MKKKVFMIGAGLTIGSALLVSSAFADFGGASGYEAYKSAMKQSAEAASATQHISVSVQDNGREFIRVTTVLKGNTANENVSGEAAIHAGDTTQTCNFYHQDGKQIFKSSSSDTYYVDSESGIDTWKEKGEARMDPEFSKEMEHIVDALVGNLKNQVTLSTSAEGAKNVDLKLSGSQIPAAANLIGSLVVKEALSGKHAHEMQSKERIQSDVLGFDAEQLTAQFPKLTKDVHIDEVALHAAIDKDNIISSQNVDITISGKDASDQAHKIVINADIETTDINATTPDQIDLEGKKVTLWKDELDR